jgi:molybdopterin converting factor small subunit
MPTVLIPTPLRPHCGGQSSAVIDGATVGEVLATLAAKHPALREHLFNDQGKLRSFVNIYLNDDDIRYLDKEASAVGTGDTLTIVPSIAGGRA